MTQLKAYRKGNISGWLVEGSAVESVEDVFSSPGELLDKPVKVFKKEIDRHTLLIRPPIKSVGGFKKPPEFWLIKSTQVKSGFFTKLLLSWKYKRRLNLINKLLSSGLPVPFFYAWLWEEGNIDRYYLISEGFLGGSNLALIAREQKHRFDELVDQGLIDNLVEILAKFHQCGYSHGDMKWSNIVVFSDSSFLFVDLDHVSKPALIYKQRAFLKDLARFLVAAFESGLSEAQLVVIAKKYAKCQSLNYNLLVKKVMPHINKLSLRKNIQQLNL